MMVKSWLRRRLTLVALVLGASTQASYADACRCLEINSPAAAYKGADAVVVAKVSSVIARPDLEGAEVTLEVKQAWKEDIAATIKVTTGTSCAYPFASDGTYLLFLQRIPDGMFTTGRCMGNRELAKADSFLTWLKKNARVGKASQAPEANCGH